MISVVRRVVGMERSLELEERRRSQELSLLSSSGYQSIISIETSYTEAEVTVAVMAEYVDEDAEVSEVLKKKFGEFLVKNPIEEKNFSNRSITDFSEVFNRKIADELTYMKLLNENESLDSKETSIRGEKALKDLQRHEVHFAAKEFYVRLLERSKETSKKNTADWMFFGIMSIGRPFLPRIISPLPKKIVSESAKTLIQYNHKMAVEEYKSLNQNFLSAEKEGLYFENRVKRIESSRVLSSLHENRIINNTYVCGRDAEVARKAKNLIGTRAVAEALAGAFVISAVSVATFALVNKALRK